jgi:hypothetical protein
MSNRCEDYPCCGHTDGLGCGWTYTPEARAYDQCYDCGEHEEECCCDDAYDECDEDHQCGDCGRCVDACVCPDRDDDPWDGMEDQWLDGSYE